MPATLVISDIHANPWALRAVFADARKYFAITEIWFLGDLVGYGPRPYLVWKKILFRPPFPLIGVAGNHDWGFLGRIQNLDISGVGGQNGQVSIGHFRGVAFRVIRHHQSLLRGHPETKEALAQLPVMHSPRPGIYLAHGAIAPTPSESIRRYTREPARSPQELAAIFGQAAQDYPQEVTCANDDNHTAPRVFAVGQTHRQRLWVWRNRRWVSHPTDVPYSLVSLGRMPVFFNPGSVGFPRDYVGCSSYAVMDWEKMVLSFHTISYDTTALREAMSREPYQDLMSSERQFFLEPVCPEE